MKRYFAIVGERWELIPGFGGRYWVSDRGRVRSRWKDGMRLLRPGAKRNGYRMVVLAQPDMAGSKAVNLHRLVALAFVPNPDGKPEVNHKDSDPANNRADNLEWVTHRENMAHARAFNGGPWLLGGNNRRKITVVTDAGEVIRLPSIRAGAQLVSERTVANGGMPMDILGVAGNICNAVGTGRKAYGFLWLNGHRVKIPKKVP
jgi:hypothetical protein